VNSFFAPLFFASIGLSVDFVASFDLLIVGVVLITAFAGKVFGCYLGARAAGMSGSESWAVGYALNARGMMEIVLGLTALKAGLIGEKLFVALVVMAILTSVVSGPMIQRVLGRKRPRRFLAYISSRTVAIPLLHRDRREVIEELSRSVARTARLDATAIASAVWAREELAPTAVGKGIAVPHARIEGLAEPVIALGLAPEGLDFQAPDLEPVRIVLLILTPKADTSAQLEILSDISKSLRDDEVRAKILEARSYTEVVAALRAAGVD
jgi:mannitol/fructose-specific phosphotransferase system IIA component (Ntr-type)